MKQILPLTLIFCLLSTVVFSQESQSTDPPGVAASTNVRRANYPRILPDNSVIFRIKAPDAHHVQIDIGKKYDMVKDSAGIWEVTTEPLSPMFHYYSLIIDGVAVADPASETFYGMGRMASGIEIPYDKGDFYQEKDVPHGDIRIKRYYSSVSNNWRRMLVYTPPGYDQKVNEKYPVLYILHGGGEDERGWATQGKTDLILDNLLAEGKAKPMIIAMLDGNIVMPGFGEQYLKNFESELKEVVIPFIENNFRAIPDANSRALAGLSMGGLQTLYAGVYNTDVFSSLGVFSSGWIHPAQKDIADAQYNFLKEKGSLINDNLDLFYISMGGKEDIAYNNCQIMMAKFDELKIKYSYEEFPGGHTWPAWRESLYHYSQKLFK